MCPNNRTIVLTLDKYYNKERITLKISNDLLAGFIVGPESLIQLELIQVRLYQQHGLDIDEHQY
jgi:hypothetical protein